MCLFIIQEGVGVQQHLDTILLYFNNCLSHDPTARSRPSSLAGSFSRRMPCPFIIMLIEEGGALLDGSGADAARGRREIGSTDA